MPFVQVQVQWAIHNLWSPGQEEIQRSLTAPKVWLMLNGEAEVSAAGRTWKLTPGSALLMTPLHKPTLLRTPQGAEWLSMGFRATLFHTVDLLQSLTRPVYWQ